MARQRAKPLVPKASFKADEFVDSLDWAELRSDFFETYAADGTYSYKSLKDFAFEKFPPIHKQINMRARWFLCCTGPQIVPKFPWKGDWETDRLLDTSKLNHQLQSLRTKIASELDILEAGKVLADTYLPLQQKIYDVWAQIESHFGGNLLAKAPKGADVKEQQRVERLNLRRLGTYMKALSWITDAKIKIDNQFLHTLGWDRPQFIMQWAQIHEENKKAGLAAKEDSGVTNILMQLAKDQIAKATMYELPLPTELEDVKSRVKS